MRSSERRCREGLKGQKIRANPGLFHLTHGVDGLQAPETRRVFRSEHQLGQMCACVETDRWIDFQKQDDQQ